MYPIYKQRPFMRLLIACCLISGIGTRAQTGIYRLVRTPQGITPQRSLPAGVLRNGEAMPANFSMAPDDQEIYGVHFFEEPLVPAKNLLAAEGENAALVTALAGFSQRKGPDDFTSLTKFLADYPKSRWRGSLLTALGIVYRRTGYYDQAMEAWEEAWKLLKDQREVKARGMADRALSELLLIYGWVGRYEQIQRLLKEIDQRVLTGPAVERVLTMRRGFWLMTNDPGSSFKCGPLALDRLYYLNDSLHRSNPKLQAAQSTPKGFSLSELQHLAGSAGLHYRMAFRQPGSPVIEGSVVHWKLEHYSALIRNDNGQITCDDATMGTTYGQQFSLTAQALDSSASGYFLIPDGPLPKGWRLVLDNEGAAVFGKGQVPPDPGRQLAPDDPQVPRTDCNGNGAGNRPPMARSNVHAGAVSLHIYDRPLYYTPPKGPSIQFDIDYHQRDSYQPANFSYSNFGPKWTFGWLSYVQDNPNYIYDDASIYLRGGGDRIFTQYNNTTHRYAPELQSNDLLVRVCDNCYELRHTDGSKEVYGRPDGSTTKGRKIFLTQIVDAAGNKVELSYDANLRVVALTDAIGQVTTLSYELPSDIYKITKVTDPFGRSASFTYDGQGRLTGIKDMIGITSSFVYDTGDFITELTTPYGKTSFIKKDGPGNDRSLEAHYPMGEKERVEFTENAPGIRFSDPTYPTGGPNMPVFNSYMTYRNTFFWDKKAMQEAPGDYTKATVYHWLHGNNATGLGGTAAPILESVKAPLESRVWFYYQGENSAGFSNQGMSAHPAIIGRRLSDGTSQFTQYTYNVLGMVTGSTDPAGRKLTYTYDTTNINLLEVRQVTGGANDLLAQYTYNDQHLPLTVKDASGLVKQFSYNASGQISSLVNQRKENIRYSYDANSYLTNITGASPGTTSTFTYDGFGRVRTVSDPNGYTITFDYDELDRPTVITYPDNTYEQIVYDRLDAVAHRDRMERWTFTTFDSLDRIASITYPTAQTVQYLWCNCGSLSAIKDAMGRTTKYDRDLQGRLISKTFQDGSSTKYMYDSTTSRLKQITDAKGQTTRYSYFIDDNLQQVTYSDALTPSVSYTYDGKYNRLATMSDGIGITKYSYNPAQGTGIPGAGKLSAIDGPLSNDLIEYAYDSVGHVSSRTVNGVVSTFEFDPMGKIVSTENSLGAFNYHYDDKTEQLTAMTYPNGQTSSFLYFDNSHNRWLRQVTHTGIGTSLLSHFEYDYNSKGNIIKWIRSLPNDQPQISLYGYDSLDQLMLVQQSGRQAGLNITSYSYRYDIVGNRLTENTSTRSIISNYNNLNQLTGQASMDSLIGKRPQGPGHPEETINNTLSYDENGNTKLASGISYVWNSLDQLVGISKGSDITEFLYDGLGRRVAEKLNGNIIRRWLWDDMDLIEERSGDGRNVVKRFFPQGEQIDGNNYYFTRDHLGSIREMTDERANVRARYDYNPYGRRTKLSGDLDADLGYTGHYYHASSALHLAVFRAYDANLGRWLSRDPMGPGGGLNLYTNVNNNPINKFDPLGLEVYPADFIGPIKPEDCYSDIPTAPPGVSVNLNELISWIFQDPILFYLLVRNKGPWDYKQQGSQYQHFGNFNYGATGSATGFPDQVLLRMAGWAQKRAGTSKPEWGTPTGGPPYGDDPEDQEWIKKGIEYYKMLKTPRKDCSCNSK